MKREEMLLKIQEILVEQSEDMTLEDAAEDILTRLEKAGMRPPMLPENYCQAIMDIYIGGYSKNQWEENVQKDEKVMNALKRREERVKRT